MKTTLKALAVMLALMVAAGSGRSAELYNNLVNLDPGGGVLQLNNNQAVGQQVYLNNAQLSPYSVLTNFTFAYFSTNATFAGGTNVQAEVMFMQNNGGFANGFQQPSNVFYNTGWFPIYTPQSLFGTNAAYLTLGPTQLYSVGGPVLPLSMILPQNFTVVYTIKGLSGSDEIGLPVYNPAVTGTNYGSYWLQDLSANWYLVTNNVTPIGLGMQFEATPEPSTLALGALGAVLLTCLSRRRH